MYNINSNFILIIVYMHPIFITKACICLKVKRINLLTYLLKCIFYSKMLIFLNSKRSFINMKYSLELMVLLKSAFPIIILKLKKIVTSPNKLTINWSLPKINLTKTTTNIFVRNCASHAKKVM